MKLSTFEIRRNSKRTKNNPCESKRCVERIECVKPNYMKQGNERLNERKKPSKSNDNNHEIIEGIKVLFSIIEWTEIKNEKKKK